MEIQESKIIIQIPEDSSPIYSVDGVLIINTTPHKIVARTKSGEDVTIYYPGYTEVKLLDGTIKVISKNPLEINAHPEEKGAGFGPGEVVLVNVVFKALTGSINRLQEAKAKYPDAVFIGSVIAAQAFPGLIYAMIPATGFERAPVDAKRITPYKFTVY
jgi:hypothetical protein